MNGGWLRWLDFVKKYPEAIVLGKINESGCRLDDDLGIKIKEDPSGLYYLYKLSVDRRTFRARLALAHLDGSIDNYSS